MTIKGLSLSDAIKVPPTPFPGLRPFEFHESDLFFGRDGQVEKLIIKLAEARFCAVVGTSGSGKSSLVRAGLMPALVSGMMESAGTKWRIAVTRPGNDPIGSLSLALNKPEVFGSDDPENAAIQVVVTEATLRRGSRGLVEAVRQNAMADKENLLVVVDQFEELFRFAREASRKTKDESESYQNDAAAFVKLLLAAKGQREVNIYVVLTMRSDFLGDCSQFWDLPEAINESQYLIPRLTRDQLREVITGPVALGGAEITPRLITQLLNDIGDKQDQLPVLQHLLMRVWDEWKEKRLEVEIKKGDSTVRRPHMEVHEAVGLDLCCYYAVGGMAEALSRHADEAFNELPDERHRQVTEKLFKALTEKGPDNREIRRPIMLGEICATTNATEAEVITAIEAFRHPQKSFLMAPAGVALNSESLIDISHESLIRGWERLEAWVEDEARSARIYRRLAETAELHREGHAGLWGDPDLQLALDWQEKNGPNQEWARRYHPQFETAMAFLNASERKRATDLDESKRREQAEIERAKRELEQAQALAEAQQQRAEAQRQKVIEQGQRLKDQARAASRLRRLMGALVVVALLAAMAAIFAFAAQRTAKAESKRANEQAQIAGDHAKALNLALLDLETANATLKTAKETADRKRDEADESRREAERQTLIAERQKKEAERAKLLEGEQRLLAETNVEEANRQRQIAEQRGQTLKQRLGRLLAVQSGVVQQAKGEAYDLTALLAVESFRLSPAAGDQALRSALSLLPNRLAITKIEDGLVNAAFSQNGKYLVTVSNNKAVQVWEAATGQLLTPVVRPGHNVKAVTLSLNGEYLATLDSEDSVYVSKTTTGQPVGQPIKHEKPVKTLALSPDGSRLVTASGDTAQMWDVATSKPFGQVMKHTDQVLAISFSPNGTHLVTACGHSWSRGTPRTFAAVYIWKAATGEPEGQPIDQSPAQTLSAITISLDGKYLATSGLQSEVRLWDMTSREKLGNLGDTGSDIAFSPDGKYLAAKQSEDSPHVWIRRIDADSTDELSALVANITHNSDVSALAFSADGKRLMAVSEEGAVGVWESLSHEAETEIPHKAEYSADIAFSSDSKRLITAGVKGFQAWKADTGEPVGTAMTDAEEEERVAVNKLGMAVLNQDGRYLATTPDRVVTSVRDTKTRQIIARLKPEPLVKAVAVSPDALTLATISQDRVIRLFNVVSARELLSISEGAVTAIALSPGRQYLATVGEDFVVRIKKLKLDGSEPEPERGQRVADSTEIARLNHSSELSAVIFSRNGLHLATASGNTARIWEAATGRPVGQPIQHEGRVQAVAFSRDGRYLATASRDKTARVWDVTNGQPVGQLLRHGGSVNAIVFSADSKHLATASDNSAQVWVWETGQLAGPPVDANRKVVSIALDSRTLITADENHMVRRWQTITGKSQDRPFNYGEGVTTFAFSPDGRFLITGSRGVWRLDARTGNRTGKSFGENGDIRRLAFSPDGKRLATLDASGALHVWSVASQQVTAQMQHKSGSALAFSSDGNYLATASSTDGTARVWNATTGQPFGKPLTHKTPVNAIAFTPDGQYLGFTDEDEVGRVWEPITGRLVGEPVKHGGGLVAIGFSPDGKYLVTAGRGAKIWDFADRHRVASLSDTGSKFAFSPDGRFMATFGNGPTKIWPWPPEKLASEACSRLIRNFTYEDWLQYVGDEPYRKTCDDLPIHPTFIAAGIQLAGDGDLQEATNIFSQLAKLEPALKINPEAETRWHEAIGRLEKLLNPTEEAEEPDELARLNDAITLYKRLPDVDAPSLPANSALRIAPWSETFYRLCWRGSLYGRASEIMTSCEWAAASEPKNVDMRDSRGLARALTGNVKGAIEDFEEYVRGTSDEDKRLQRQGWIDALRGGNNPFTSEELQKLRGN